LFLIAQDRLDGLQELHLMCKKSCSTTQINPWWLSNRHPISCEAQLAWKCLFTSTFSADYFD